MLLLGNRQFTAIIQAQEENPMSLNRYKHLTDLLQAAGLDALALNPGPTLTYLTGLGFHLSERPTVLLAAPPAEPALILAELEILKAKQSSVPVQPITYNDNPDSWQVAFNKAVQVLHLDGKKIGVEPERLRVLELNFLENAAPGANFISAAGLLASLRMQKDEQEIAAMRKAVKIAQEALLATMPFIKAGVTEHQVATELTLNLLRAGSDPQIPFSPIVSSGPNSANPHASPSERKLASGDLVVIDWGAAFAGYFSDLTRTFAIGQVIPEFEEVAKIVGEANAAGRRTARPGITAGMVDKAARDVITKANYGPFFHHRVGHGLGMEGHEPPYMYGENQLILAEGMTFTVEPGIYLADRGGVRIEDDVVITRDGAETLSDLPRELIHLV
jgi:Xaa-Pro dipeptidase